MTAARPLTYNNLKRNMFGDDEKNAKAKMYKIDGHGIEDIFSRSDFCKIVLCEPQLIYEERNSQYVKKASKSKVILAYQFSLSVGRGEVKLNSFEPETRSNIKALVKEIVARLMGKVAESV
jgi:hypothetical protein